MKILLLTLIVNINQLKASVEIEKMTCYEESLGFMVKGEKTTEMKGVCGIVTCEGDNLLTFLDCADVPLKDNCYKLPEDLSKPYPKCCPQLKCT